MSIPVKIYHELTEKNPTKQEVLKAREIIDTALVSLLDEAIKANVRITFIKKVNGETQYNAASDNNDLKDRIEHAIKATILILGGI